MASILNKHFPNIFYINLDRRQDRREQIEEQLFKLDIKARRRVAIVGNPYAYHSRLKPGEIGCLLSHLELIKIAQVIGYPSILILEDDSVINKNIDYYFQEYYNRVPSDWEMLYFGGNHNEVSPTGKRDHLCARNVFKCCWCLTTGAYALRESAYQKVIDKLEMKWMNSDACWMEKVRNQIDVMYAEMQDAKQIRAYCFTPALITQADGYSDVQETTISYKELVK